MACKPIRCRQRTRRWRLKGAYLPRYVPACLCSAPVRHVLFSPSLTVRFSLSTKGQSSRVPYSTLCR